MIAVILALAAAQPNSVGRDQSLPFPPSTGGSGAFARPAERPLELRYEARAKELQVEMANLKQSDGGRLTPQHKAYLHKKLVALLDAYDREVVRENGR